jgi:His-Xaa-Ser system protein HxsD
MNKKDLKAFNELDTIKIDPKKKFVLFKISPKVFSREVVVDASYILSDKANFFIAVDQEDNFLVEIQKLDDKITLEELIRQFNMELLNYAVYKKQSEKNKVLRETLMKAVLETNTQN